MNFSSTQIFDFLLGNTAPLEQTGFVPVSGEKTVDPALFGAILGEALNPQVFGGVKLPGTEQVVEIGFSSGGLIPATPEQSNLATPEELIETDASYLPSLPKTGLSSNLTLIDLVSTNPELESSQAIDSYVLTDMQKEGKNENSSQSLNQNLGILGRPIVEFNATANDLTSSLPITLKPGTYEIVDQESMGDKVALTLVTEEDEQPIRLIIPGKAIVSSSSRQQTGITGNRIEISMPGQVDNRVNELLQALNLKQIEIKAVEIKSSEQLDFKAEGKSSEVVVPKAIEITLLGDQSGHAIEIKRKLNADQVRASRRNNSVHGANKNDVVEKTGAEPVTVSMTGTDKSVERLSNPFDKEFANKFERELSTNGGSKGMSSLSKGSVDNFSQLASLNADKTQSLPGLSKLTQPQPVRFTLPDDIRSALQPGGKSITIAIEPENLGHARLSLALHDNGLRARVVVENMGAKILVEKSLDQLTSQLSRVDVKIDSIEVAVSDRNAGQQHFHEPQAHRNRGRGNNRKFDNNHSAVAATVAALYEPRGSYVSRAGVDVMA